MFKVIIAGGRDFNNYQLLFTKCCRILDNHKTTEVQIVSGTAKGADTLGERFAKETNTPLKRFPANWDLYGKSAGVIRNSDMADYADALIAFWDGKSRGTKNMIAEARLRGLPVRVIYYT